MSALQLAGDGVITKHPACEVASKVKWKQPPVIKQNKLPQVGDKVKAEYKGKLYDATVEEDKSDHKKVCIR